MVSSTRRVEIKIKDLTSIDLTVFVVSYFYCWAYFGLKLFSRSDTSVFQLYTVLRKIRFGLLKID